VAPPLPVVESFYVEYCPQSVLETTFYIRNFRTVDAASANNEADEIYDRWVWCNVYVLYRLIISKKLYQALVAAFSKLDQWPKKKNVANLFWQNKIIRY